MTILNTASKHHYQLRSMLMKPNNGETAVMAATARVIWLYA